MKYYRYGSESVQYGIGTEAEQQQQVWAASSTNVGAADDRSMTAGVLGQFGELVIDDDTVYEIDEECLQCRKRK